MHQGADSNAPSTYSPTWTHVSAITLAISLELNNASSLLLPSPHSLAPPTQASPRRLGLRIASSLNILFISLPFRAPSAAIACVPVSISFPFIFVPPRSVSRYPGSAEFHFHSFLLHSLLFTSV
ncbi:hypothetical protein MSAN_00267100 [Mycena sanguinolenta]|uniref:Uncharacterized protein n=1 Tax=Mycena sanguinolenta TaxID=230812 RepID=A0A8H6ZG86_9AGAR|nr:hypothetical protein MSAN_00267100 [Mycena sanguinolenta]